MKGIIVIKERDKAREILNVLMKYYVVHQFSDVNANISISNNSTDIIIKGKVDPGLVDIAEIKNVLSHPRMREYDDYYEGLLESSDQQEFTAIGYLVDESMVNLKNDILAIKITRYHI